MVWKEALGVSTRGFDWYSQRCETLLLRHDETISDRIPQASTTRPTYLNVVVGLGDERPSFPLDLARTTLEAGEDLPH